PFGDAARFRGIEIDDVDRPGLDQPAHACRGHFALPGIDRDGGRPAHLGHHAGIVVPEAWLLEPGDVVFLDQAREPDRLGGRPAAVGIDGDPEIVPGALARRLDTLCILFGTETANLDLASGEPGRPEAFHFRAEIGERLALLVVSADADDRQFL